MLERNPVQAAIVLVALLAALTLPQTARTTGGATLSVVPSATSVAPGDTVDVAVVVSGLGNLAAPSLGNFGVSLTYDDSIFSPPTYSVGTFLGDPAAGEAVFVSIGFIGNLYIGGSSLLTSAELIALQPDTFTLFTASFDVVGVGSGIFDLAPTTHLGDENHASLPLDSITPGIVTSLEEVAIPTLSEWGILLLTAALLGAGLFLLRQVPQ